MSENQKNPLSGAELENPNPELEPGSRIYWAIAAGHSIANFITEERSGGKIVRNESSLSFKNHIYIAHDKKTQGFIENSRGYINGKVQRVSSLAEAQTLTELQKAQTRLDVTAEFTHTGNRPVPGTQI